MFNRITYASAMLFIGIACLVGPNVFADDVPAKKLMTVINYAEWESQRLQYLPNIVVVDMWAMWCVSCIERFPEMVKLHNKYKDQNVKFVSMNLDDREDKQSLALAEIFLHKMNADFEHYHMNENLLYAFEKMDLIGIPAVLIYDLKGNEQYRLTGDNPNKQFTEKDIEEAISKLLDQT
ncbi:MAG: thioredoxin domain-containing protein [Gammaproteobacteria bacterium]